MSTLSNLSVELSVDLLDFLEIFLTDRQTDLTLTLLIFWRPRIPAKSVCLLAKTSFYYFAGPPILMLMARHEEGGDSKI